MNWHDEFPALQANPTASAETQVKYMRTVLQAKEKQIDSLTLELAALKLERALETKEQQALLKRDKELSRLAEQKLHLHQKRPWWKFWR